MSELTARRWEKGDGRPASYKPAEALEVALHRLRTGEIQADHVVICIGTAGEDGTARPRFYQAGSYNHFAQLGLLHSCANLLDQ